MNIFLREMKAHRKSLIIWSIGMLFIVASGMGKYTTYAAADQSMNELLQSMPKAFKVIMGVGTFDLTKAMGFYGVLYMYLVLMAAIHAVMLGAGIISKEERDKTAEFLYVKPVSRAWVLMSKGIAAFTIILILNLVTLLSSISIVGIYAKGEDYAGDIVLLMVGMLISQIIFLSIGIGTASIGKRPKAAGGISACILLVTFILSIAIDLNESIDGLKYFTPFKYFTAEDIMNNGFNAIYIVLSALISLAFCGMAYAVYCKRDLKM